MNNELIERIDEYLKNYLGADLARQLLRDCKKALEAKPDERECFTRHIDNYAERFEQKPVGYVLVPIEPSGKILLAGYNALTSTYFNSSPTEAMLEVYNAMLSAVKEKE